MRVAAGRILALSLALCVPVIFLNGCGPVIESLLLRLTPSPAISAPAETLTVTQAPTLDLSACAFVWSNREIPEVSTQVNQAFRKIGLVEVEVEATAYGENCLDTETNRVVSFSAMQTDFYFVVATENINDAQFLGEWVERIAGVMEDFQPGEVPGPNPGFFAVTFANGSETINLWFTRSRLENLLEEGVRGRELLETLQNP